MKVFVGEIWGPCARPPELREGPDDPEALSFQWTDETIAILAILREILAERIEHASWVGATKHVRIGLSAIGLLEKLVTERPRGVLLEPGDILGAGLFLYFDILVMQFHAMGMPQASLTLRRMGWKLPREKEEIVRASTPRYPPPPSSYYSSYSGRPGRHYGGEIRSPDKGASAAAAPPRYSPDAHSRGHVSPEPRSNPSSPPEVRSEERPPRKTGGPILSPPRGGWGR